MIYRLILTFILLPFFSFSQNYTSYFTGNPTDVVTMPDGGVCMMGGATEDDSAMVWFLNRANGGDVLVIRASGADGYNNYMYSGLGVTVNSVETIVFNNATASNEAYIHDKIMKAEAIWIAGGDQWNYVDYWRNTAIDSLIRLAIRPRNIVIGGTSAGMAVLGEYYFTAENGTVTSATALANPYDPDVKVSHEKFLKVDYLHNMITDTHFDSPDRKGRLVSFMARASKDDLRSIYAIACDEYTAVCIDAPSGIARVFGGYPTYDDNAYFLQVNCEPGNNQPEVCTAGNPLNWDQSGEAVKVCKIKGTPSGASTFNTFDWLTTVGGTWENWSVANGVLSVVPDDAPVCIPIAVEEPILSDERVTISPNPTQDRILISSETNMEAVRLLDLQGKLCLQSSVTGFQQTLSIADFPQGLYLLEIVTENGVIRKRIVRE